MTDEEGWLKIVTPAALVSALPFVVRVWQWWKTRGDAAVAQQQTSIERRDASLLAEREALTKAQADLFAQFERDMERAQADAERDRKRRVETEARLDETERDRDRGWDLARLYYRMIRDMAQALSSARALASGMAERTVPPTALPRWREFRVPQNLEDPPTDAGAE